MSSDKEDDDDNDSGGSFWAGAALGAVVGGAIIGGLTYLFTRQTERPVCNPSHGTSETFRQRPLKVEECSICKDNMDLIVKLPCGHRFHRKCVQPWLEIKEMCPNCRHPAKLTQMKNSA